MDRIRKKVRKTVKEIPFFPDEIVTNILIRLPVKSVMKYRLVCRRWRDITLGRDFVDLHLGSSLPVVLVSTCKNHSLFDLFAIDKWWGCAKTRFNVLKFHFNSDDLPAKCYASFSQSGLIVFRGGPSFIILNPARPTHEYVTITLCDDFRRSDICALYYHPSLNQYCCLLNINKSNSFVGPSELIGYKLLNLGSNPSLKTINYPFDCKLKDDYGKSLFIGKYMYWMLKSEQDFKYGGYNDILAFDIISEEFMVIPCPIPLNTECMSHQTQLVNNDGMLSFVLILTNTVTIWRLEDQSEQLWISTDYTVNLEIDHNYKEVVIFVVDGKLVFQSKGRLFVCNLMEGTVRNYPKRKYSGDVTFFSHLMSLASLKNCKSELYINKNYKVLT